ncbi:hypothetical protein BGZ99_003946 [Dissophora globulifera]|uniref:Uncharacterized protein n=1 Tax=Dissophora globulifera TaxID=979702 RepID=A0A9P6RIX5_9FUNG|nr:hypothetical protein BGZ99_003946 [Dissophora globulifera]
MFPWRPLGMLAFGLTIIFLFIRLHGDGYDFPVKVAKLVDELDFPKRPDRTFIEVSGVYHDHFREWGATRADDNSDDINREHQKQQGSSGNNEDAHKFMGGWNAQWTMGIRKNKGAKQEFKSGTHGDQDSAQEQEGDHNRDEHWIWMTNIWHQDGDCGGPGFLRQYRRRLDHALTSDNSTSWELMYTHRFPGPITHTSLSKRVVSSSPGTEMQEHDGQRRGRELIRLAVVYKIVQDEHVAYHSRVYHFGTFQSRTDLKDKCPSPSTETCHVHAPFVNFDYVLPGSTPIKDFSLEHDTILYSRLSDTALFRSLKLPVLKIGATSPEKPYALSYGVAGPSLTCQEKKNVPYRMSYLFQAPSSFSSESTDVDDVHVLAGMVHEYTEHWEYQLALSTQISEGITGNKKWLTPQLRSREFRRLMQENDMINDEPQTYGVSIQKPYFIRSADGSSIHIPIKNVVMSLETDQRALLENIVAHLDTIDPEGGDYVRSLVRLQPASTPPQSSVSDSEARGEPEAAAPESLSSLSSPSQRQQYQRRQMGGDQFLIPLGAEHYLIPSSNLKEQWVGVDSHIDAGTLDTIDTDQGVINDAGDVMVLRTTRNGILILKRSISEDVKTIGSSRWRLSMIMSDDHFFGNTWKTEVLGMKIVSVEVPVREEEQEYQEQEVEGKREAGSDSDNTGADENMDRGTDPATSAATHPVLDGANDAAARPSVEQDPVSRTVVHNILVLVYGSGTVYAYDVDVATESSSAIVFLREKYLVVIGMLAVVVAFVINEAR